MADKIYAYDDYGIKHETMSRAEIENAISTGEIKKNVFEGSIEYEGENVPYSYVGTKLDEAIIRKLLACGISPVNNKLIPSEIQTYLSLPDFSIHFYYSETEIYATNAKNSYLGFEKIGIGTCKVYPNGNIALGYYMKSSAKMNDVRVCKDMNEFNNIAKDEETNYIVENAEYTQNIVIDAYYDFDTITTNFDISILEVAKADRYVLKLTTYNEEDESSYYYYIPLSEYTASFNHGSNDETYHYFKFINNDYTITITKCDDEHLNSISIESTTIHANTADEATHATNADNSTTATTCTGNAETSSSCTGNAKTATTAQYAEKLKLLNYFEFNDITGAFTRGNYYSSIFINTGGLAGTYMLFINFDYFFTSVGKTSLSKYTINGVFNTDNAVNLPAIWNGNYQLNNDNNERVIYMIAQYKNSQSGWGIQLDLYGTCSDTTAILKSVALLPLVCEVSS